MDDEQATRYYRQAEADLHHAREELYKPSDDVVKYTVCTSARTSLYRYLSCLYALHHEGEDLKPLDKGTKPLQELLDEVTEYYEELGTIDFSPVRCKCKNVKDILNGDEIYFCNNLQQVRTCTDLASIARKLVIDEIYDGEEPDVDITGS